jgi:hypothetical protein
MILVVQSFGKEYELRRAIFSVLSYYACADSADWKTTFIFTDNPEYFHPYLAGLPVQYRMLTEEKIKSMRGEIDFLHRMKIAIIEEGFTLTDSGILYFDSDTFFVADPTSLIRQIDGGQVFMHLPEYPFVFLAQMKMPGAKTFHAFLDLIRTNEFTVSTGTLVVKDDDYSWNAGVMGLPRQVKNYLSDVYTLTDYFYRPTLNHASEQYAFSVVLQKHAGIQRCDRYIYHYWYRIKKEVMDDFNERRLTTQFARLPLEKKLHVIRKAIAGMPEYLENHVLTLRDNAMQYFWSNDFGKGYRYALRALSKDVFNLPFLKDILYHTKRFILGRN